MVLDIRTERPASRLAEAVQLLVNQRADQLIEAHREIIAHEDSQAIRPSVVVASLPVGIEARRGEGHGGGSAALCSTPKDALATEQRFGCV